MSYLERPVFEYLSIYYRDFIMQKDVKLWKADTNVIFGDFQKYCLFIRGVYREPYKREKDL
jgi:hypothetical protein